MSTVQRQTVRMLECLVERDHYCFETRHVAGVFQSSAVRGERTATSDVAGVLPYGGQEIPVLNLRGVLGYDQAVQQRSHVAVIRSNSVYYGVLVDGVLGARELELEQLSSIPLIAWNAQQPFFDGVVNFDETADQRSRPDGVTDSFEVTHHRSSRTSALLIAPGGLIGESQPAPTRWPGAPLDLSNLRGPSRARSRQIMLFDVPNCDTQGVPTSLALSISQVLEVIQRSALIRVPGAPTFVEGLVQWRRQVVPVVDLSQVLGLATEHHSQATRLVVARSSSAALIAFYASTDIRTLRLPIDAKPHAVDTAADHALIHGSFLTSEGIVVLPNLDRFLAA